MEKVIHLLQFLFRPSVVVSCVTGVRDGQRQKQPRKNREATEMAKERWCVDHGLPDIPHSQLLPRQKQEEQGRV